jgi:hypothetical protein
VTDAQAVDLLAAVAVLSKSLAITNGLLYGLVLIGVALVTVGTIGVFVSGVVRGRRS